jgi:hypothetical protein
MTRIDDVAHNERIALAARERLASTLAEIQGRLTPDRLARNAWDTVREQGRELADDALATARRKPFVTGALFAAILLFFARGLVWRLAWRALMRARDGARPAGEAGEE